MPRNNSWSLQQKARPPGKEAHFYRQPRACKSNWAAPSKQLPGEADAWRDGWNTFENPLVKATVCVYVSACGLTTSSEGGCCSTAIRGQIHPTKTPLSQGDTVVPVPAVRPAEGYHHPHIPEPGVWQALCWEPDLQSSGLGVRLVLLSPLHKSRNWGFKVWKSRG